MIPSLWQDTLGQHAEPVFYAMVSLLIALAVVAPKSVTIVPKESAWVYANASTPTDGTFLRAWGVEGKSCPPDGEDAGQFSYSFLKWDLSEIPAGAKLVSAKLSLNNTPDPGYTIEAAKHCPVEVRPVIGDFEAKTWAFELSSKIRPNGDAKAIFGTGYPKELPKEIPVPVTVDLMAGPNKFAEALAAAKASASHSITLAITAKLDPSADGRAFVYKFFGPKESKEWLRPQLVLTFSAE